MKDKLIEKLCVIICMPLIVAIRFEIYLREKKSEKQKKR